MGAKILQIAEDQTEETVIHRRSYYQEDLSAKYLLVRTDERRKAAYFIRVHITGLRARVFGPFRRKSDAIRAFDSVLKNVLQAFCDFGNEVDEHAGNGREHVELPDGLLEVEGRREKGGEL